MISLDSKPGWAISFENSHCIYFSQEAMKSLQKELDDNRVDNTYLTDNQKSLENTIEAISKELEACKGNLGESLHELQISKKSAQDLKEESLKEVAELASKFDENRKELQTELQNSQNNESKLSGKIELLEGELKISQENIGASKTKIEELSNKLAQQSEVILQQENQVKSLENEKLDTESKLQKTINDLKSTIELEETKKLKLSNALEDLATLHANSQAELGNLKASIEKSRQENLDFKAEIKDLKTCKLSSDSFKKEEAKVNLLRAKLTEAEVNCPLTTSFLFMLINFLSTDKICSLLITSPILILSLNMLDILSSGNHSQNSLE